MRVVIIGFGTIARRHLTALKVLKPDVEVYALRSNRGAVKHEGVVNIYDLEEIVPLRPDFVILSNPTSLREEVLMKIGDYGFPLFIEKPALQKTDLSDAINKKLKDGSAITYVACNLRFLGCLKFVNEELKRQRLTPNEVNVYCGSYLPDWRPGKDWRSFYSANSEMGGGAHLDLIHELDYLFWMFGHPESVSSTRRSASQLKIDAIDYAHYRLAYTSFVASVTLNYFRRDYKREFELVFPDFTWTVDLAANTVRDHKGVILYESKETIADTYLDQMAYFLRLLTGEENSFNTFANGISVLKIALSNE